MADSKREAALKALFALITGLDYAPLTPDMERNAPERIKPTSAGLLVLRDGDPGEPDVDLSPPAYHYRHAAELVVVVKDASQDARDSQLDGLLQVIGSALLADDTLGGVVEIVQAGEPVTNDDGEQGSVPIKSAVVPIYVEYTTYSPLL